MPGRRSKDKQEKRKVKTDVVVAKGQLQRALRGEEVVFRNPVSDEDRRMQSYHRGYISERVDAASMFTMLVQMSNQPLQQQARQVILQSRTQFL